MSHEKMPGTPADCVDDIPLTQLHRDLIIVRIELLINRRVSAAIIATIEEAHAAAMRALIAPITAAEVAKASAAVDPALIGYRPNNDFGDLDSGVRDHDEF